jgi:hypothetical protein
MVQQWYICTLKVGENTYLEREMEEREEKIVLRAHVE